MGERPRRPVVLLVEDDAAVRSLLREILESGGYEVLEAATASDALAIEADREGPIEALLTDVVLPAGMGGFELARELTARRPELKVFYTSGYEAESLGERTRRGPQGTFIGKPFQPRRLLEILRRTLDSG